MATFSEIEAQLQANVALGEAAGERGLECCDGLLRLTGFPEDKGEVSIGVCSVRAAVDDRTEGACGVQTLPPGEEVTGGVQEFVDVDEPLGVVDIGVLCARAGAGEPPT